MKDEVMLPYGMANFEEIITEDYMYIDKTEYIKHLERSSKYLIFLRPRRFGKSLFVSTLENYYDIKKEDKFDELFKDTYIGKNPTKWKNSYCILKFNFSGIITDDLENLKKTFKKSVVNSLKKFVYHYDIKDDISINENDDNASSILEDFLTDVKPIIKGPIYVLIDEYDQFANELLSFHSDVFSDVVSSNGFVRKFYEILKKGTDDSTIGRIFITGVSPITLDSMTSGFNITINLTCNPLFNSALGFTQEELQTIMKSVLDEQIYKEKSDEILEEMKYNYDGYMFSEEADTKIYNSDMCLYYLKHYKERNKPPKVLLDTNIASDYSKLTNLFSLKTLNDRDRNFKTLEEIIAGKKQIVKLTTNFNFERDFEEDDFISLVFYLVFLTITGEDGLSCELGVPNNTIKSLYFELFLKTLSQKYSFNIKNNDMREIFKVISSTGKNDLLIKNMEIILNSMSNRDFQGMNEQVVKTVAFTLSHYAENYIVKSEYEVNEGFIDIAYLPMMDKKLNYYGIIEFKYIKVSDYEKDATRQLEEKKTEAYKQLMKYVKAPELSILDKQGKLKKWIIIFCKDKCVLNEEI